ncbi:hypothetical protein GLOIN_2v1761214 [Rhizophagus clarus]|uniref:Uncharacterized protein n=1 Tax=Rhizophagus clarus TaxID=94130 RepID=A0A8H3LII5_9GLOM|nr:hypothetical protein GLOIN_2v1761214 [Rhizophagus clarus]
MFYLWHSWQSLHLWGSDQPSDDTNEDDTTMPFRLIEDPLPKPVIRLDLLRRRISELGAENAQMPDLKKKVIEFEVESMELRTEFRRVRDGQKFTPAEFRRHNEGVFELETK